MGVVESKTGRPVGAKGPTLDEPTFQNLRRRITSSSGIYVLEDENSRFVLERRLAPRLRIRGVTSFSEYESTLDTAELHAMLDVVAVHETYFFREKRQLKAFSDHILPELSRLERPLKIWSAGCSTGEEAYTIAMLLAEQRMLDGRVQVVASDLSQRVVEFAVRGIYGASSFRTTGHEFQKKYFSEAGRGGWQINDELRGAVRFEQSNIMAINTEIERGTLPVEPDLDVVFCRNVLMYFDDEAAKRTVRSFYSLLREGGYLLLGHAETLLPLGTGFASVQFGHELVHKK